MTAETTSKTAPASKKSTARKPSKNSSSPVPRLNKYPGLSITKSSSSKSISLASKSSLTDLSDQLKTQLQNGPVQDSKKERETAVNKPKRTTPATRPSLPKSVTITTNSIKPKTNGKRKDEKVAKEEKENVQETPAKPVSVSAPSEPESSPALQRKRLLELIAAERAEEEKKRRAKRSRGEVKSTVRRQQSKNPTKKISNPNSSTSEKGKNDQKGKLRSVRHK